MKNFNKILCLALIAGVFGCDKPDPVVPEGPENEVPEVPEVTEEGYIESVPDTVVFTNSQFIYNGDDIGTAESDGWVIKLYTDMEIDDYGNPVGPGSVVQMLLNVAYDENQSADPSMLDGRYSEMMNSGDFSAGTFVSGYLAYIDIPGGRIEMADATFYADVKDGTTEMDYDLIDEGAVEIVGNDDGTYTITGVLVGKKYTKRYFTWTGTVSPESHVPEQIPNSTLTVDFMGATFAKAQIQDKGDRFYLMDQSYRCFLLYLVDETVDLSSYRPAGDGFVLRMEILVPWDTDINDGIPAGVYEMVQRCFEEPQRKRIIELLGPIAYIVMLFSLFLLIVTLASGKSLVFEKGSNLYKKTIKGTRLTQQINALKRFIQAFTKLEEETKNELVKWNEFLIYTPILEEDTQIVEEITTYKKL